MEEQGHQEESKGLEVTAPGGLDHQQRGPEVQHEHRKRRPAAPERHSAQQPTGTQVEEDPDPLEDHHGAAHGGAQEEHHLGQGWVDGGNRGVVDESMPGRSDPRELGSRRSEAVGIQALRLDVSVPEVAVYVVRQHRIQGEQDDPEREGEGPHDPDPIMCPGAGGPAPESVRRDRHPDQEEGGEREVGSGPPPGRGQGSQLDGAQDGESGNEAPARGGCGGHGRGSKVSAPDPTGRPPRPSVAVLIPALDEEEALPGVLDALPRSGADHVVVVDNGSTDGTAEVARFHGATVVTEERRGYGSACLAGLRHLAGLEAPPAVVVFLDADQSDDPGLLPQVVAPIVEGRADLVLGVRGGSPRRSIPVHARLGNGLVLTLVRLLFGVRFHDLPPFRAIDFDRLRELAMDDRDWGWTLQMQIRAHRRGLRIVETTVSHRPRSAGESKISGSLSGSLRAGSKMLYTIARERLRGVRA